MWSWFSFFIGYATCILQIAVGLLVWGFVLEARTDRIISRRR